MLPRSHTHWLHSAMSTLTKMSNNRETQVVGAIFMVVLTLSWFRHRRGIGVLIPAVLILAAYEVEHQLQHTLKVLAARTGPVPAGRRRVSVRGSGAAHLHLRADHLSGAAPAGT